jgi:hypothetical protein
VRDRVLEQTMGATFASTTSLGPELVLLLDGGDLPTQGEISVRRLVVVGGAALGVATFAGHVGASPSQRARDLVTRNTPLSTAKRELPCTVHPRFAVTVLVLT